MSPPTPFCIPIDQTTDYAQWHALWKAYLEFYNTTLEEEQYRDTFDRLVREDGDLGGFVLVVPTTNDDEGEDEEDEQGNKGDAKAPKSKHPYTYKYIGLAHYLTHTSAWAPAHVRHCYLNDLFVSPSARCTGGGRLLIEAAQEQAKKLGCSRLYWLTAPDNKAARKLYDKVAGTNRVAYRIDL